MATILGLNAVFHDPAAALVVDGRIVACAEEERFSRRKHGKTSVPFSTWELPVKAAAWCLAQAGVGADELDAVGYSYDPDLAVSSDDVTADDWEGLRTVYVRRAPLFLRGALPGLDPAIVRFVPHHVAHAASAHLAAPFPSSAVLVLDGRGERASYLAGHAREDGSLEPLAVQELPHSLGLLYEDLTEHLGFMRSSDEYKVMGLAAYGEPRFLEEFREVIRTTSDGGFAIEPPSWDAFAKRRVGEEWEPEHADLAASVQLRLEEVLLDLARWVQERTGEATLTMAGGVALNCLANSRLWREGPFDDIWIQPAAGDAGTALGAALALARRAGDRIEPMTTAALGSGFDDDVIEATLRRAKVPSERPDDLAGTVADALADDGIVAWFQGRAEYGPRALGHRSLIADPRPVENLERMNDVKGREQFRPIAPIVLADRAADVFEGPMPSPYMLFTHEVRTEWRDRIPAVTHVDGSARIQTVDPATEPLLAEVLRAFERRTGVPVLVNTSLNTAGRPIVDSPADVLELFGSAPVDLLAIGPYVVRRSEMFA